MNMNELEVGVNESELVASGIAASVQGSNNGQNFKVDLKSSGIASIRSNGLIPKPGASQRMGNIKDFQSHLDDEISVIQERIANAR